MKDNIWVLCEAAVVLALVLFGYVMLFAGHGRAWWGSSALAAQRPDKAGETGDERGNGGEQSGIEGEHKWSFRDSLSNPFGYV